MQPYAPPTGNVPPHQNADPLRTPLMLIAGGLALQVATRVFNAFLMRLLWSLVGTISILSTLSSLASIAGYCVFLAGVMALMDKKRPGNELALGAGIAAGVQVLLMLVNLARVLVHVSSFGRLFMMVASMAPIAALGLIVLSLRQLAKSRGRSFDGIAIGVAVALACDVIFAFLRFGGFFYADVNPIISLIDIGARVAVIVGVLRFGNEPTLADPTFEYGNAYRGPTGVMQVDPNVQTGNMALGFCAGFFGGCIGLGLVLALAKGPKTKRGAGIGFACQTVVGIALQAAAR
jgi:hypothetical protein